MPYGVYAECPCCGKIVKGEDAIETEFGFRTMEKGKVIPQSYCRKCRSAKCQTGNPKH